jgi:DNA-binding MarR family transcriptional regulator
MSNEKVLRCLINEVRKSFRTLAAVSDEMLQGRGLTASSRAVLEHLVQTGPATVPAIAAEKSHKRQSIQVLVDRLGQLGLIEARANPAHRRSVLICPTVAGERLYAEIRQEEDGILKLLASDLDPSGMAAATDVLAQLSAGLENRETLKNVQDA